MGNEIERKFLVQSEEWRAGEAAQFCRQGYLATTPGCAIRIRVLGEQGYLTIKGRRKGISRLEFEYSIPLAEAHAMLDTLCSGPLIEKYRHIRHHAGLKWEIDEFMGENRGLIVAEVELRAADQVIGFPSWVGPEVSEDPRYLNENLATRPYALWHDRKA
jgi:CYTH domain-containing protein